MGLNAFFTYTVVLHMGHSWQVALGAVFISATMFFLLSIFRIREWIINSIPCRCARRSPPVSACSSH